MRPPKGYESQFWEENYQKHLFIKNEKSRFYNEDNLDLILEIKDTVRLPELKFGEIYVHPCELIRWAVGEIKRLNEEGDKLEKALVYLYESGELLSEDTNDVVRSSLGLAE